MGPPGPPGPPGSTIISQGPAARVTDTNPAGQDILNNVTTTLTFDAERYDPDGMHDNTVNNSRLTAPVSGFYQISGAVLWEADPNGFRNVNISLNGTTLIAVETQNAVAAPGFGTAQTISTGYYLNAGDYVELTVQQSAGGTIAVEKIDATSPEFAMALVA